MDWLVQRKFLALATTLVLLLIVAPLLSPLYDGRLLLDILLGCVFLASALVLYTERHMRNVALLLGIPTMVGLVTGFAVPGLPRIPLAIAFHLLAFCFFCFTVFSMLRNLHKAPEVSADSIFGSFCGYMLIGLAFSHLYSILGMLEPGSFRSLAPQFGQPGSRDHYFLLNYFSFVTLTTVGYGDVTPATDAARSLACVEAVTGQFYIAVLVAELIGKRVSQAIIKRRDDASE